MSHERNNPGSPERRISAAQASSAVALNTVWNLIGTGLPILLALITVPVLINSIGNESFGVFSIAWVLLSYFGLFDLGLGRATTKFLAEAFEHNRFAEGRALFWTTIILSGALGLVGTIILTALTPLLVDRFLNIPAEIQTDSLNAFYLMALSVPLIILTASVRGVLEAQHRFGLLNALQVPTSALNQAAPLLVLPFDNSLTWIVGALVLSRLLGMLVFLVAAIRQFEDLLKGPFFLRKSLRPLFSYGGWLTVTNVIGPLMVYVDRFVIGALSSMTAVAYYATPYEATARLSILSQSLSRTVFPIFAAESEARQRTRVYVSSIKHLALILAPVVATLVVFAPDLLRLWVGEDFAENSTAVLQILAIGVFVNSLAMVPYTLIQGMGRPDITAKFHLLELPFYLFLLWYGIQHWGIVGAAFAWTVRVGADGLLLALYARLSSRFGLLQSGPLLWRSIVSALLLISSGWLLHVLTTNLIFKIVVWGLLLTIVIYRAWKRLLTLSERKQFIATVNRIVVRVTGARLTRGAEGRIVERRRNQN